MVVRNSLQHRWVRSPDGIIAGVCKGIADAIEVDVVYVRIAWVLAFFLAGFGGFLYIGLALAFPKRDQLDKAYDDKVLGVCSRLAIRTDIEVGLIRAIALASLCLSLGGTSLAYIALYFILPAKNDEKIIKTI